MATLQAIRLPDIDPPKMERPKVALPDGMPKLDLPSVDLSSVDVGDALTDAAQAVGLRKSRRSPWPFALAGLMIAGASWIVMTNQGLRTRLGELARAAGDRIRSWQRSVLGQADLSEPVAFTAAQTKPIPAERWSATDDGQTPDYPDGLGSDDSSRPEESALGV